MKRKKIVGIFVITLLIAITIIPSNTFGIQISINKNIENENQQDDPIVEPKLSDPIYFKTWNSDEFDEPGGYGSTILGDHIYVIIGLYDLAGGYYVNDHIGVLKFNKSDGSLSKSVVIESNYDLTPCDIVSYQNHIYVYGKGYTGIHDHYALCKLDADLKLEIYSTIDKLDYTYFVPQRMAAGNDGIYIGGELINGDRSTDIFLAKFDEDCNPVWEEYSVWERSGSELMEEGGIEVYNGFIYLTGEGFILKFSSSGEIVKSIKLDNTLWGTAIGGFGDQIYICFMKANIDGIITVDLLISAYDSDLNEQWKKSFNKGLIFEKAYDIVATSDFLYICGAVCNIGSSGSGAIKLRGFVLKFNINKKNQEWYKEFSENSGAISIIKDNNYLYVSGMYWYPTGIVTFLMKCDLDWGKSRNVERLIDMLVQKFQFLKIIDRIIQKLKNIF